MTATNHADRSLTTAANRLTTRRPALALTRRWSGDAHLDGWTPTQALAALAARDHPHHDRLVRGLTIHSQRRDEDATVLLLAALRPALWKLAHTYHRAHSSDAFDALLTNAVHVIARLDPSTDRLYDRIVGRVRSATCHHARPQGQLAVDLDQLPARGHDPIEPIAARDVLRHIADLLAAGSIDLERWNDLIAVRVHGIPAEHIANGRTPNQVRANISRLSQRLERLRAG